MDIRSDNLRVVVTGENTAIGKYLFDEYGSDQSFNDADVLINCVGKSIDYRMVNYRDGDFEYLLERNLSSVFNYIRMVIIGMRKRGFGRIINMSSVVSHIGVTGTAGYSAAKSGLWGLVKVLAKENADKNILINNLNLGYMDGGMTHRIKDYEKIKETIPLKKFGDFKEIANAIEFLVRSDYITGTNIEINGGLW